MRSGNEEVDGEDSQSSGRQVKRRRTTGGDENARRRVVEACEACRIRKTKCGGGPAPCLACRASGRICTYRDGNVDATAREAEHQRQISQLQERVEHLTHVMATMAARPRGEAATLSPPDSASAAVPFDIASGVGLSGTPTAQPHENSAAGPEALITWPSLPLSDLSPMPLLDPLLFAPADDGLRLGASGAMRAALDHSATSQFYQAALVAVPSLTGIWLRRREQVASTASNSAFPVSESPEATGSLDFANLEACLRAEVDRGNAFLTAGSSNVPPPLFDDATFLRLQEAYFQHVNNWFPLLEKRGTWREHFDVAESSNFAGDNLSVALVLLTFACGDLACTKPDHDPTLPLPGYVYFLKARDIIGDHILVTSLAMAQCHILVALVLRLAEWADQ